jgi:hypothetical protein
MQLAEEADVVLEKDLNLIDAVFQHGQAIDTDGEGKAADFLAIVVDEAIDGGVHHACAKELDPARTLALTARAATCSGATGRRRKTPTR